MKWKKDNKLPNTKSRVLHGGNMGSFDQAISPPLSSPTNDAISMHSRSPMNIMPNNNHSPEHRTMNGYESRGQTARQMSEDYFGSYDMSASSQHQPQRRGFMNSAVERMLNGSPGFFYQRQSDYSVAKPDGGATVSIQGKFDPLGMIA